MKKIVTVCLVIMLFLSFDVTTCHGESYNYDMAEDLKKLNIFLGSNGDFFLDEIATREQGAIMVVRMIGKVDDAISEKNEHPFEDVSSWASDYVGYLYKNDLTNGISPQLFGAKDAMTADQYYTYLLRALGYKDSEGDFIWSDAVDYAVEKNIIESRIADDLEKNAFIRNDIVYATHLGLQANVKGSSDTLLGDKLYTSGALSSHGYEIFQKMCQANANADKGKTVEDEPSVMEKESSEVIIVETPKTNVIKTKSELETYVLYKSSKKNSSFTIDISNYYHQDAFETDFDNVYDAIADQIVDANIGFAMSGYGYNGTIKTLNVDLYYSTRNIVDYNISDFDELVAYLYHLKINFIEKANVSHTSYNGDFFDDFEMANEKSSELVEQIKGVILTNAYSISGSDYDTSIILSFDYTKAEYDYVKLKAKEIVAEIITEDMDDYEKVKTVHDYVVENMIYDQSKSIPLSSYTAYGSFALGVGVCEAYSEAINIILHEVDIPCFIISGYAGGPHAWNIVAIGGNNYHLDATWDDPVMSDGSHTIMYDYFLISDEEMSKDHTWSEGEYPKALSSYKK